MNLFFIVCFCHIISSNNVCLFNYFTNIPFNTFIKKNVAFQVYLFSFVTSFLFSYLYKNKNNLNI